MIKVYGIKNCDSVKKAISFFKKNNLQYTFHDFKTDSIDLETINEWLKKVEIKKLFNSKSTTYRKLKLKELNLNDTQRSQYLSKENLLIKRPVTTYKNEVLVGFDEEIYTNVFL
jgi:Spx/MgsR family transcriptional regulator